jgi:aspartokinase/homoserine dehydrogenase 1
MQIFKIGGSSVTNSNEFDCLVQFITKSNYLQSVYVISAFGKLSSLIKSACFQVKLEPSNLPNSYAIILDFLEELTTNYPKINIESKTSKLLSLLKGISLTNSLSLSVLDNALAQGEIISLSILEDAITDLSNNFNFINANSFIRTDSNFGNANINYEITYQLIKEMFNFERKSSYITNGFIASDGYGKTTTMGFESSNLTAIVIANQLNASEINVITDFGAIFTADPKKFSNSLPIECISYNEAEYFAKLGMKLLYKDMITLAKQNNISINYSNLNGDVKTKITNLTKKKPILIEQNLEQSYFCIEEEHINVSKKQISICNYMGNSLQEILNSSKFVNSYYLDKVNQSVQILLHIDTPHSFLEELHTLIISS